LHALGRSLEGFRRWVQQGDPYLTPGISALPVLAAVEAIYRSADSGSWVAVEPIDLATREMGEADRQMAA
jgi:predicted dehydrogenase